MFRLWTERATPQKIRGELDGRFTLLGSAAESPENPLKALTGAQAIIAGATIRYDGAFMDKIPELRVISRTGIGIDNIVIADATTHGIAVCSTPDGPTVSTAEHTIMLMLMTAKQVQRISRALREQKTRDFFTLYQGLEMDGLVLGLVGLGRIGSRVAAIASSLGMRVLVYDPYVSVEKAQTLGIQPVSALDDLLASADVVSLHLPLTPETHHLMNHERFGRMKPGALFINAARGGLVDESALLAALERGHLRGAGLDVFDPEPPPADHPLLHRDDVVATPHVAGVTLASRERMWRMAIDNAWSVLNDQKPQSIINPEVLKG